MRNNVSASGILILISIIVFVLAAFGVTVGGFSTLEFVAIGSAFFAAGHLV